MLLNESKRDLLRNKYVEFVIEVGKYYPTEGILPTLKETTLIEIFLFIQMTFTNPKNYKETLFNLLQVNNVIIDIKKKEFLFNEIFLPFISWFKSNVNYI